MEPTNAAPRIDEHFDHIRANLIRCEECSENFFFDFLRHPRYFVTHFKTCHLKNVLYRFNGCSEEENQRVRFGPRRKKDAKEWFGQLKSTEKRMISMQDNKWGEIAERECWSCRLCKQARKGSEIPHTFEPNELGRRQALLHLRQFHETAYNAFLSMLPAVDSSSSRGSLTTHSISAASEQPSGFSNTSSAIGSALQRGVHGVSMSSAPRQSIEAERSRLRRMRATPEAKKAEAERSRRRREKLTPAQRQADADRRARKRQRAEQRARSRLRRADASPDAREREVKRSRERRQNATEQQRKREAQRSRMRRQNATEKQRLRERERCRRRYEIVKQQKLTKHQTTSVSELEVQPATPVTPVSDASPPPASVTIDQRMPPRSRVLPADLERRNQQLLQQQAGLGLQLRSLYASLSLPTSHVEL
ncbi:hypothetical protein PC129_g12665 [Phytophthora cactorum]|uniref:Uncharacterized protein n=3 Tax=Phytophthora TaxID=4783 RepID=A0A329RWE8_9STRA|nr:hypothetical protein Pcac1_g19029 [Phytophthora cactorum]KAG2821490.1 hypothetical protein PC112_g11342 [Phytophthora cactorum]KAG2828053.1 hypothetical protein PC111_g8324 [Phytophthora cactorum]KAG2856063.1 hypothetical protein PC113_g11905 [Phytophthora cactorum]KAG2893395.1 hypothetical protein PC114_g16282 [Phytophthora cactorum]